MTINDWANGRSRRPFWWERLVRVAAALELDAHEASLLLEAAGHPSLDTLVATVRSEEKQTLLAPWRNPAAPFQAPGRGAPPLGRDHELAEARRALLEGSRRCLLVGMAGVGKSTLAIHLAHELRPYFPDGVLWAALPSPLPTGLTGSSPPVDVVMPILASFAQVYGYSVREENTLTSRQALVRALLADRRVLIVIDNAFAGTTMEALLPTLSCGSLLVTSRLQSLWHAREWTRVALGPLAVEAGCALLARHAGVERVEREIEEAEQIVRLVGGLPLALRAVGRHLHESATSTLHTYRTQFAAENQGLHELDDWTDASKSVRVAFEQSYRLLEARSAEVFAALAVFEGPDVTLETVADTVDLDPSLARKHLARLVALSLLDRVTMSDWGAGANAPERYRMHALLKRFAAAKLGSDCDLLRERAIESLIGVARRAHRFADLNPDYANLRPLLVWAHKAGRPDLLRAGTHALSACRHGVFGYLDAVAAWREGLDLVERSIDTLPRASREGARFRITQGAFLVRLGQMEEAYAAITSAVTLLSQPQWESSELLSIAYGYACLARHASYHDPVRQREYLDLAITTLRNAPRGERDELGYLYVLRGAMLGQCGDLEGARESALRGLELLPSTRTPTRVVARQCLGTACLVEGDLVEARRHLQAALEEADALGDRRGRASLQQNLAIERWWSGALPEALAIGLEALRAFHDMAARIRIGILESVLARILIQLTDLEGAERRIAVALEIASTGQVRRVDLYARLARAHLHLARYRLKAALVDLARAEALIESVGDRYLIVDVWQTRALAHLESGRPEKALEAIQYASELRGTRREEGISARIHGQILHQLGRDDEARRALILSLHLLKTANPYEVALSKGALGRVIALSDAVEGERLLAEANNQMSLLRSDAI